MNQPTAVVVLSGGMDSTTLAAHYDAAGYRLVCVTVDYGQRHRREIASARAVAAHYDAEHIIVDLSVLSSLLGGSALTDSGVNVPQGHYTADTMRATVVPNRNAILANVAIGFAIARGAEVVALGMHAGDHAVYPDCRPEFVEALHALAQVANEGFNPPRIEAPFVGITKTDIAARAHDLDAPLYLTWSCYQGGVKHCGRCGTCVERYEALRDAGVPDPTEYEDGGREFAEAALAKA